MLLDTDAPVVLPVASPPPVESPAAAPAHAPARSLGALPSGASAKPAAASPWRARKTAIGTRPAAPAAGRGGLVAWVVILTVVVGIAVVAALLLLGCLPGG
jgi:hypothetical protein